MKLIVPEAETAALRRALDDHDEWISAMIVVTEVTRAVRRWIELVGGNRRDIERRLQRTDDVLRAVAIMDVDIALARQAGDLQPAGMRSLGALHLATALAVAPDLAGLVTYDARLAAAATATGLTVWSPGTGVT